MQQMPKCWDRFLICTSGKVGFSQSGLFDLKCYHLHDDDEEFDISSFACSINWWQRRGSGGVKAMVLCIIILSSSSSQSLYFSVNFHNCLTRHRGCLSLKQKRVQNRAGNFLYPNYPSIHWYSYEREAWQYQLCSIALFKKPPPSLDIKVEIFLTDFWKIAFKRLLRQKSRK